MDRDLHDEMEAAEWFVAKVQDKRYAQNLYAALCNMRWQPREVFEILRDEYWTCSWRSAGSIVADLRRSNEDYLDFYCSGMSASYNYREDQQQLDRMGYVNEGTVTDEIREDLLKLGWQPSEWPND